MSTKRGRPPLAIERRSVQRFVFRTTGSLAEDIRLFAEYQGMTVQQITRHWWQRAIEKHPEFRVPEKRQDEVGISR